MDSLIGSVNDVIKLLYVIAIEEPLTFIFLIVIVAGYYYCRDLILTKLRKKLNLWQKIEGEQNPSLLDRYKSYKKKEALKQKGSVWEFLFLILRTLEFVLVILVALYLISPKWLNRLNKPLNSFKNEPAGFRSIKFKTDIQNFLSFYPSAQRIENINLKDLQIYLVSGEQFFDWNDVNIRFVFYKNRFYQTAIDYTPIPSGNDIDTEAADPAAGNLMLNRATGYYGSPEIYEKDGIKLYIWSGHNGSVRLDTVNNSLILIDSQLFIEYNSALKLNGP